MTKWTPAGAMRKRLTFLSGDDSGTDSMGSPLQAWASYYECWGSIDIHGGQLLYDPSEFVDKTTYMLAVRYPGTTVSIAPQDRISCDGQTYVIAAVMDKDKFHRELTIIAYQLDQSE